MKIRAIEAHEVPLLLELGQEFYEDSGLPGSFSEDHFVSFWQNVIGSGSGVVLVPEDMTGGIGALLVADPNSGAAMVQEMFWFVSKQHRKGTVGLRLLDALERWSAASGAQRLHVSHLAHDNGKTLSRLFERRGFAPTETHYMKEVQSWQ